MKKREHYVSILFLYNFNWIHILPIVKILKKKLLYLTFSEILILVRYCGKAATDEFCPESSLENTETVRREPAHIFLQMVSTSYAYNIYHSVTMFPEDTALH
jgi:hypothetical protein